MGFITFLPIILMLAWAGTEAGRLWLKHHPDQ